MKKFMILWLIAVGLLSGCFSSREVRHSVVEKPEVIRAFFIANDSIYGIGDLYSYQFPAKYSGSAGYILARFLNSKYRKAMDKVKIYNVSKKLETSKLDAAINIELNYSKLSEQEIKQLPFEFREAIWESSDKSKKPYLYSRLEDGNVVILQNRKEIMAKYQLVNPLQTKYVEYTTSEKWNYNHEGTELAFALGVTSIIFLPVALISAAFQ